MTEVVCDDSCKDYYFRPSAVCRCTKNSCFPCVGMFSAFVGCLRGMGMGSDQFFNFIFKKEQSELDKMIKRRGELPYFPRTDAILKLSKSRSEN
jgi:hypothetical protein